MAKKKDPLKLTHADLVKSIREILAVLNIFHWKQWQGPMSQPKGVSDILGLLRDGRFLAIEAKVGQDVLSGDQAKFLRDVRNSNGIAFVARSANEVIERLDVEKRFS